MLAMSYIAAGLAISCAALYLWCRLGRYVTASSILLGFLLLVHGPAYLVYILARAPGSTIYESINGAQDLQAVILSLNVSIALMFIGMIVGIELVDRLSPFRARQLRAALQAWNAQRIEAGHHRPWLLAGVVALMVAFMATISISEHHLSVIRGYLAVVGSEFDKIAYRQQFGGSQSYPYRVLLSSLTPMLIVWAGLSAWIQRWWLLSLLTVGLFALTIVGKLDTLSKAPAALFIIQLVLVGFLIRRNDVSWRVALAGLVAVSIIFYPVIRVAVPEVDAWNTLGFLYYRIFDNSNEAALEFFATFPHHMPHGWGANIRPVAYLLGRVYAPSYLEVLRLWHGGGGSSVTAMFIADAWVDFSYVGVIVFSVLAGTICRAIDILFLVRGKTVLSLAVLASTFIGVYHLMISALPAALLSGGLVSGPAIAVMILKVQHFLDGRSKIAAVASGQTSNAELR